MTNNLKSDIINFILVSLYINLIKSLIRLKSQHDLTLLELMKIVEQNGTSVCLEFTLTGCCKLWLRDLDKDLPKEITS